tara:strand:- start:371 stop:544 length:174 start_codon:yes stop_codon:yes gene_type:complete
MDIRTGILAEDLSAREAHQAAADQEAALATLERAAGYKHVIEESDNGQTYLLMATPN